MISRSITERVRRCPRSLLTPLPVAKGRTFSRQHIGLVDCVHALSLRGYGTKYRWP
jgi:hypothetical protein